MNGRLAARWVFPVSEPPIEHGVVEIRDGRIAAVHGRPDREALDLGDVALIPGLVNAHTHLEFSGLEQPVGPASPFADWVRTVIRQRKDRRESGHDPIARGLQECRDSGTALVGEITTAPGDWFDQPDDCSDLVLFRELRGLLPEAAAGQRAIAAEHLEEWRNSPRGVSAGLSPHAPYSVGRDLLQSTIDLAVKAGCPVAMHVAETQEELLLLSERRGPLADLLKEFGVWRDDSFREGVRILDVLKALSQAPRALVIHGNYLTAEEIRFLGGEPQMSVVYCPRTHLYFGHQDYPLTSLLEAGVNVALGTDSRASNPDLNLWREALTVRSRHPEVTPQQILAMATAGGAQALGASEFFGSLASGRPASLAVVALDAGDGAGPWERLFGPASHIQAAMHRGSWTRLPPELEP